MRNCICCGLRVSAGDFSTHDLCPFCEDRAAEKRAKRVWQLFRFVNRILGRKG